MNNALSNNSPGHFLYLSLADIRMPLFTVLSGWVYSFRPIHTSATYHQFIRGKIRRLIVPLGVLGTLWGFTQSVVPDTNATLGIDNIWRVWLFSTGYLWFLQSIFLIMLFVGLLDRFGWLATTGRMLTALLLAAVVAAAEISHPLPNNWDFFGVAGFFRLLPFFMLGRAFCIYRPHPRPGAKKMLLIGTFMLFSGRLIEVADNVDLASERLIPNLVTSRVGRVRGE